MKVDELGPGGRVVIAGGGTGGHLVPALALARELVSRNCEVLLVGTPRDSDQLLLSDSEFPYRLLAAPALQRQKRWQNAGLPFTLAASVARARRILVEFRPDAAVGTGGYVMVPVILAARLRRVPILLQEQNRIPGIATRFLARWARGVCVQFADSAAKLGRTPVEVTGSPIAPPIPVRSDFTGRLDRSRRTVGVFGGSQGASAINDALLSLLARDPDAAPFNLVWQTGIADHARVMSAAAWPERFVVRPFFAPMNAVYPLLDLIVGRAGALTLAEITAWGLPSILVPYPWATADHQMHNARAVEAAGGAIVLPQRELESSRLEALIRELLVDEDRRRAMSVAALALGRPDAAARVADRVIELVREAA